MKCVVRVEGTRCSNDASSVLVLTEINHKVPVCPSHLVTFTTLGALEVVNLRAPEWRTPEKANEILVEMVAQLTIACEAKDADAVAMALHVTGMHVKNCDEAGVALDESQLRAYDSVKTHVEEGS